MLRLSFCLLFIMIAGLTLPPVFSDSHETYEVVHGWPVFPDGYTLGEAAGVEVDSHNHVWVFHRGKHPVLCIDAKSGKILQSWGDGLFESPHGLTVDSEDNIWVTDNKSHLVSKFSHEGKPMMTLGSKGVAGQDGNHFMGPTDVAVSPNGDIYVTDGYGNSRVAKFDKNGKFLLEWGRKGKGDGEFHTPHGITLDDDGLVYIADRENIRMQIFDPNGKFLKAWKSPSLGRPWGVDFRGGYLFVADGGDLTTESNNRNRAMKMDLNGNVLAKWGSFGSQDGQFYWAHHISAGDNNDVYVVDVNNGMRVQKFVAR